MSGVKTLYPALTKWNHRFLSLADLVGSWSKDPSTKVGAVIVDDKNRVISVGYNGYPHGVEDSGLDDRNLKLLKTIHAEENALLFANKSVEGCILYVSPLLPCGMCMAKIIQSGITRIVARVPKEDGRESRWKLSNDVALNMAEEVGIEIIKVST